MLLPSSPPPSTLSAFVGLLKFVVGRLLSYWDPRGKGLKVGTNQWIGFGSELVSSTILGGKDSKGFKTRKGYWKSIGKCCTTAQGIMKRDQKRRKRISKLLE
ncbi:hypothetical protein F2Q69_00018377 [Brassica cretica]|uniref:Uncharacterized protein n=1 Tax=Brassica cretica TaxID=69181 RepID=A0A8S9Q7A0_BRACR|nr:hypothetical protein F2Q69_00018377 [Brassica cretica]